MKQVEINQDGFVVDAALLSDAFKLQSEEVRSLMRNGAITSRCETGVDEDAGQSRLTFHYRDKAVRFVVDQTGTILKRVSFPTRTRKTMENGGHTICTEDQEN